MPIPGRICYIYIPGIVIVVVMVCQKKIPAARAVRGDRRELNLSQYVELRKRADFYIDAPVAAAAVAAAAAASAGPDLPSFGIFLLSVMTTGGNRRHKKGILQHQYQ